MAEEVDVVLFGMENENDLRTEYPELSDIPEFKNMDKKALKFCYLVGNRTSPIYSMSPREKKIERALTLVYGVNFLKKPELKAISEGDIPQEIISGIERMLLFNAEYRFRAKMLSQYMFDILTEIVIVENLTTMDMDERKKYTDLVIKVHSELPSMVKTVESSFGVKLISRKTKGEIKVNINDVMK